MRYNHYDTSTPEGGGEWKFYQLSTGKTRIKNIERFFVRAER